MIALFVTAVFLAVYPLVGYPLIVGIRAFISPKRVARASWTPTVTILIPAYNEEKNIARTIENKLQLDYPRDRLQIIVVSDCSEDGTDEIVRRYATEGVQLIRRNIRQGKAAALNEAVSHARGELLVFSDANSVFAADAVLRLAENFADAEVGYVTGCLQLVHDNESLVDGGSAYLRYENWLRELETRAGSIIGVNGGCDAIRRELYVDIPADQITDFVLPLHVLGTGHRVVYDERVRATEVANKELASEFRMRVRVALRALRGLWYMRDVMNPLRSPWTTFCILSHKVLRYLTFAFLLAALWLNATLATASPFLCIVFGVQLALYAIALIGVAKNLPGQLRRLTALPTYFLLSNVAFAIAFGRFLRGESMATWRPRGG